MATSPDTSRYYTGQRVGLGHVPSYEVAGAPFVTGSTLAGGEEITIQFPAVTKSITLFAAPADDFKLNFAPTGSGRVVAGNHQVPFPYATPPQTVSPHVLDVKCKSVTVSSATGGQWSLYASLTGINIDNMFPVTGSGITD
jgi:hypothetical protein